MQIKETHAKHSRCIFCLKDTQELTEEHIFPEAAGGHLTAFILCKSCNSLIGQYIDAPFLKQKNIELARSAYRLSGKKGYIPQPFSDIYSVESPDGTLRFRLDKNFTPRSVPEAPKVWITENKKIGISVSLDKQDRKNLPAILKTTLIRFFKSETGNTLGWTLEEQERAIQRFIDKAMEQELRTIPISTTLQGSWTLDLRALYTELVKVTYEIGYLQFGENFLHLKAGCKLREFLLAQCSNTPPPWELVEIQKHLQLMMAPLPPEIDEFTQRLCQGKRHNYHLAFSTSNGIACSLLDTTSIFYDKDLGLPGKSGEDIQIYINSVTDDDRGVFSLFEVFNRISPYIF